MTAREIAQGNLILLATVGSSAHGLALHASPLPERPDHQRANEWLIHAYLEHWSSAGRSALRRQISQRRREGNRTFP